MPNKRVVYIPYYDSSVGKLFKEHGYSVTTSLLDNPSLIWSSKFSGDFESACKAMSPSSESVRNDGNIGIMSFHRSKASSHGFFVSLRKNEGELCFRNCTQYRSDIVYIFYGSSALLDIGSSDCSKKHAGFFVKYRLLKCFAPQAKRGNAFIGKDGVDYFS